MKACPAGQKKAKSKEQRAWSRGKTGKNYEYQASGNKHPLRHPAASTGLPRPPEWRQMKK